MKKLAFLFVAVAAMSMVSCGGNTQQAEEAVDSVEVAEAPGCTHVECAEPCDSCAELECEAAEVVEAPAAE